MVIEIAEDPQGYLWIATQGHGLFRYQPETGKWKQYGTKEGFDNPTINHLHIDGEKQTVGGYCRRIVPYINRAKTIFPDSY